MKHLKQNQKKKVYRNINKPPPTIDLSLNNSSIRVSNSAKYLGVTIGSLSKFGKHISSIEHKISTAVGIISNCVISCPLKHCKDHPSSGIIIFVFMLSVLSHYVYFQTRQCFVLIIISYFVFNNQR